MSPCMGAVDVAVWQPPWTQLLSHGESVFLGEGWQAKQSAAYDDEAGFACSTCSRASWHVMHDSVVPGSVIVLIDEAWTVSCPVPPIGWHAEHAELPELIAA